MQLPHKFGRYILTEKIAEGGMAEVYRAQYLGEGSFIKNVAIKRILPAWSNSKNFIAMFCDEARALVHLQHQNIVQIYELGKDGNAFYISMEYVNGIDLRRFIKKIIDKNLNVPLKYICFIIAGILKALGFAHSSTIIHRDISPQNILLSYNGEVKVVDFGIAKGAHRSFETITTQVKGKYAYMSPEQAQGKKVDRRTDIYSVGVILYELITKKRLHDAPNDFLTIEEVKKSALPNGWGNNIPNRLQHIVKHSLEHELDNRYQTASDFLKDLTGFVSEKRLITHEIEFSTYLKDLCHDEYVAKMDYPSTDKLGTKILTTDAKCQSVHLLKMVFVILALIFFSPDKVQVLAKQTEELDRYISTGTLNIQAKPWGYVYVAGYIDKKETPIRGLKLETGNHLIKIYYEPEDKWLEKIIDITDGSVATCLANFEDGPTLKCK